MLSIIEAAGWPIWLIIVTSVIALAIIGERDDRTEQKGPDRPAGRFNDRKQFLGSKKLRVTLSAHPCFSKPLLTLCFTMSS